jgi:hypothetical protein
MPLSANSPTGSTVTAFSIFVSTRGLIKICPGFASSQSREPIRRYSHGIGKSLLHGTVWWGWEDSNFQPNDYEPLALSSLWRFPG